MTELDSFLIFLAVFLFILGGVFGYKYCEAKMLPPPRPEPPKPKDEKHYRIIVFRKEGLHPLVSFGSGDVVDGAYQITDDKRFGSCMIYNCSAKSSTHAIVLANMKKEQLIESGVW